MANLGPNFYKKLIHISNELGMKPEDILNVMVVESGINPSAHNSNGNASGLVQFMPNTLKNLGFKGHHSEFRNLSGEEQLDYVKKLIQGMMGVNGGPFTSAAQYYIGNFIPAALKIPGIKAGDPKTIICSKNPTVQHIPGVSLKLEKLFYTSNPYLDADKDGNITFGDIQTILNRAANSKSFLNALANLEQAGYKVQNKMQNKNVVKIDNKSNDNLDSHYKERISKYELDGFKLLQDNKPKNNNADNVLNMFLQKAIAHEKNNQKFYKKSLPLNNFLLKINSFDYNASIEFCRMISNVLDEEAIGTAIINADNNNVELEIQSYGSKDLNYNVINEICNITKSCFLNATKKIGNININYNLISDAKSNLKPIDIKTAYKEYKKFILRFY